MPASLDLTVLLAFVMLWAVIVPTPGANSLMVTHVALTRSPAHVELAIAGNMLGNVLLAMSALLGMAALLAAFPWARLQAHPGQGRGRHRRPHHRARHPSRLARARLPMTGVGQRSGGAE